MRHGIERAWARDGVAAWALTPFSWLFGAAVGARNLCYDLGVLRSIPLGLPAVSVGNLTVGGTGKTPVSSWVAGELARMGGRPAILLRGYGGDEAAVHDRLSPGIPVIANPDRVSGAVEARARSANVLVLDDAFQHRRAARDVDIVLVAAEQQHAHRLLPAGPLRERRAALRRATVLVVTRKSATMAEAEAAAAAWTGFAGAPPSAIVHLTAGDLRGATPERAAESLPSTALRGKRVLAISAIGAPEPFHAQLAAAGAIVDAAVFTDHHAYDVRDAAEMATRAAGADLVCCTLKDAVKLGVLWSRQAPPLWYLSQAVVVERGDAFLLESLRRLVPLSPLPHP